MTEFQRPALDPAKDKKAFIEACRVTKRKARSGVGGVLWATRPVGPAALEDDLLDWDWDMEGLFGWFRADRHSHLRSDVEAAFAAVSIWGAGHLLEHCSDEVKGNADVVLAAVEDNGRAFLQACTNLQQDPQFVLAAVKRNGGVLEHVDERFRSNRILAMEAVLCTWYALKHASAGLRADRELVMHAVRQNGCALEYASPELRADREIVMEAVKARPPRGSWLFSCAASSAMKVASPELRGNYSVVLEAVKNDGWRSLRQADPDLQQDRSLVLAAVRGHGRDLHFLSNDFRSDVAVVSAAVENVGDALQFASEPLRSDRAVAAIAVRSDPLALRHAGEELRSDLDFVLEAVRRNGLALQYAGQTPRQTRAVVLAAVKQTGEALQFADQRFWADEEIVLQAIHAEALMSIGSKPILEFCDEKFRRDRDIVLEATKSDVRSLKYAAPDIQRDPSIYSVTTKLLSETIQVAQENLEPGKKVSSQLEEVFMLAPPDLLEDKDFVVLMARMLPAINWTLRARFFRDRFVEEEVMRAARSLLATPGEEAPILLVDLSQHNHDQHHDPDHDPDHDHEQDHEQDREQDQRTLQCKAHLMSGASFCCSLRVDESCPPNLNDLATKLVAEMGKYAQAAERVFITLRSPDDDDDEGTEESGSDRAVRLTPWDWARPLTDLLPAAKGS